MKSIIETLEAQHRLLETCAGAVASALAGGDLEAVRREVGRLQTLLVAHVTLENSQFYPTLVSRAEAKGDPRTAQSAKLFESNMARIAEAAVTFCTRWEKGIADRATFTSDWKMILDVLVRRIADEERTLHPMFTRLEAHT